jgi:RNA polymerase sigma factor (sigma-70 family)
MSNTFQSSLAQFRDGNISAFSLLYDATIDRVYAFVYRRTLDTYLTEEIVSMTYMKAIKNFASLRATTEGEFFSWMFRIAYTTYIDTQKYHNSTQTFDLNDLDVGHDRDIGKDIDNRTKLEEVLLFLDTFSQRDRRIMTLRIWDDLSYEEIAYIT